MLIIPFEIRNHERGPLILVVVLEPDNLDRMRRGDPADLKLSDYASAIPLNRSVRQLDLVIAYEEDTAKLLEFKQNNDIVGLLQWLERGRKIIAGDLAAPVRL